MQTERRVAANPQTKPTDLGCESAERLAATIRRHQYYSYNKNPIQLNPNLAGFEALDI